MNKTCKDCIHNDVCFLPDVPPKQENENKYASCSNHKSKSRYIELPCAVGDMVWFDTYKKNGTVSLGIQPHKVDRIDVVIVTDTKSLIETQTYSWEIGKRVFLSKEQAEQVLKGGENDV